MQTMTSDQCKPVLVAPTPAIIDALDRDGFAVLPAILDADAVAALRRRLATLLAAEGELAGAEVHREAGTDRLANLIGKGEEFRPCVRDPRVLGAVERILGPSWRLSSLNSRSPVPGGGRQALHADWGDPPPGADWQVCNSVWLLDDMDADNGGTRIVPGSHRWAGSPSQAMTDPGADHPRQIVINAAAGSVVVFNSHCWHGGTINRSGRPRRALFAYFTRRDQRQQTDQRASLPATVIAGLTPQERWVLDV